MPCCTISDCTNHEIKFKVTRVSYYLFLADEIKEEKTSSFMHSTYRGCKSLERC